MKRHSRKISNSLTKPLGYPAVNNPADDALAGKGYEDSKYEMRALMEPSHTQMAAAPGKLNGESFDVSGSELGDRDSGKGMMRV